MSSSDYAVIKTGGKQYRVTAGSRLRVEKLDAQVGEQVTFGDVLMVGGAEGAVQVGMPTVAGATVKAEVLEHGRHAKIKIVKFKRRKDYRRTAGHRQHFTALRITEISG